MSRIICFFNDTATTEIYTLSLHDALPIYAAREVRLAQRIRGERELRGAGGALRVRAGAGHELRLDPERALVERGRDRKSTRLNSSHANISYAVFCLKKKSEALYSASLSLL